MNRRAWWRAAVGVLAAAVAAAWPTAASAHVGGPPPTDAPYYETALTSVSPHPSGVGVQVSPTGDWIQLTESGAGQIVVSGYGGEPYLRVTSAGVWQNNLSPTAYLNQSLFVDAASLTGSPGTVAPRWRKIAQNDTARWHDHRIHWMGISRPPGVAADPTHRHVIGDWKIRAHAGRTPFEIRGTLSWRGKPSQVLGISPVLAVVLTLTAVIGLITTGMMVRPGQRRAVATGSRPGPVSQSGAVAHRPDRPRGADIRVYLAPGAGRQAEAGAEVRTGVNAGAEVRTGVNAGAEVRTGVNAGAEVAEVKEPAR